MVVSMSEMFNSAYLASRGAISERAVGKFGNWLPLRDTHVNVDAGRHGRFGNIAMEKAPPDQQPRMVFSELARICTTDQTSHGTSSNSQTRLDGCGERDAAPRTRVENDAGQPGPLGHRLRDRVRFYQRRGQTVPTFQRIKSS
jgi:hypothetical protein